MNKLKTLMLVAVAIIGLISLQATPASASPGVVAFAGTATTPALGYPGVSTGTPGTFTLTTNTACRDESGACSITISGPITSGVVAGGPYCGNSAGSASGTYSSGGAHGGSVAVTFSTAGGVIEFSGSANGHAFRGSAVAVPTGGSCATGTATSFTVTGTAVAQ